MRSISLVRRVGSRVYDFFDSIIININEDKSIDIQYSLDRASKNRDIYEKRIHKADSMKSVKDFELDMFWRNKHM